MRWASTDISATSGTVVRGDVSGAGGLKTSREGLIKKITNKSGHYKPGAVQMIQTVEGLLKKGALLDKQWADANGQPLSGQALQVYNGVMAAQEKIMDQLADDPNANVAGQLEAIDKAKKMLTKLGCGPSNRISTAVIEFLELKQHMTGEEIVTDKGEETKISVFRLIFMISEAVKYGSTGTYV